ncbi:hypothetical protein POTOM_047447 [Populus tomentosa]|uniref:Uncharacterized protein n=1 Tax=Populus tomentosa TaxID=118781 RepID=A0A8X8C3S0_POPTO|nr:hypothetical protein POTOM_047447 [Populus tomentosa]
MGVRFASTLIDESLVVGFLSSARFPLSFLTHFHLTVDFGSFDDLLPAQPPDVPWLRLRDAAPWFYDVYVEECCVCHQTLALAPSTNEVWLRLVGVLEIWLMGGVIEARLWLGEGPKALAKKR